MTSAGSESTAGTPSSDPAADARFAAYVASLKADVDDPEYGEEYRALLAEDPDHLRALFDLAEAYTREPAAKGGTAGVVAALIACLAASALLLLIVWRLT